MELQTHTVSVTSQTFIINVVSYIVVLKGYAFILFFNWQSRACFSYLFMFFGQYFSSQCDISFKVKHWYRTFHFADRQPSQQDLILVLDTNVLLSHLDYVKSIRSYGLAGIINYWSLFIIFWKKKIQSLVFDRSCKYIFGMKWIQI